MDIYISDHVNSVVDLYDGLVDTDSWKRGSVEQLELMATRLQEGYANRHPGAMVELSNWSPGVPQDPVVEFGDSIDTDTALLALAREHGYARWNLVKDIQPDPLFEEAVEATMNGEADKLQGMLKDHPQLTQLTSHWYHKATLLHYCAANGVETHRQRTPLNLPDIVHLLLSNGADMNALGFFYGMDMNFLGLLTSSAHPADAGVTSGVVAVLSRIDGQAD